MGWFSTKVKNAFSSVASRGRKVMRGAIENVRRTREAFSLGQGQGDLMTKEREEVKILVDWLQNREQRTGVLLQQLVALKNYAFAEEQFTEQSNRLQRYLDPKKARITKKYSPDYVKKERENLLRDIAAMTQQLRNVVGQGKKVDTMIGMELAHAHTVQKSVKILSDLMDKDIKRLQEMIKDVERTMKNATETESIVAMYIEEFQAKG